jgi:ArsR family transcriptional regulator
MPAELKGEFHLADNGDNGLELTDAAEKDTLPDFQLDLGISEEAIEGFSKLFTLFSDPSRVKILLALARLGELHVTALRDLVAQSQPVVSHHLMLMRLTGLVSCRREGRRSYYRLEPGKTSLILGQFLKEFCDPRNRVRLGELQLSHS